jgi:hypothetical protein
MIANPMRFQLDTSRDARQCYSVWAIRIENCKFITSATASGCV